MSITARIRFGARPVGRPFRLTLGSSVDVTAEFVDDAGAPVTVSGVTMTAREPDGAVYSWTEGTLTESSPGVWFRRLTPPVLGSWLVTVACASPAPETAAAYLDVLAAGDVGGSLPAVPLGAAAGDVSFSGLTMATARLLGRSTAAAGAIEQITVGDGLVLANSELSADRFWLTPQDFGAVGNGVVDDTAAITAAYNAAVAAGASEIYFPPGNYRAPGLKNVGQVHFRGPGRLVGAFRKQVIPFAARAAAPFFATSDCVPATHLRQFARALNPVVVLIGDSTGVGGNALSAVDFLAPRLQEQLSRQNANRTIVFHNRSIGGAHWGSASGTYTLAPENKPSWWTGPDSDFWLANYVLPLAPDLIVWNFGTNNPDQSRYFWIDAAVAITRAWPKPPSHLFCTNLPRSNMADTGVDWDIAIAQRDNGASGTRNYARITRSALADFHRFGCMARDGFDPASQRLVDSGLPPTLVTPSTTPNYDFSQTTDFDMRLTFDNTTGLVPGTGGWGMRLVYGGYHSRFDSGQNGPRMRLVRNASALQYEIADSGGAIYQSLVSSGIAMPNNGVWNFIFSKRQGYLRFLLNGTVFFEGVTLDRGGWITPRIEVTAGTALPYTITEYNISEPVPYVPSLTDAEMFGPQGSVEDGNGTNHPAARTFVTITGPLLDATNLCADDLSTGAEQTITAAGAINLRATHVKLIGPAAGSYAITLAPPTPADGGRTMMIEMISTTATNTVTLALTNVIGGTAATTCTWDAARESLTLVAQNDRWQVVKQFGVTLT
jgi:hypothetical protein